MKKRLLSALLALVMVLALLPVSVFADPSSPTGADEKKDGPEMVLEEEDDEPEEDGVPVPLDDPPAGGGSGSTNTDINEEVQSTATEVAGAGQVNQTATYIAKDKAATTSDGPVLGAPGYYVKMKDSSTGKNVYYRVNNGLIVGGKYVGTSGYTTERTATVVAIGTAGALSYGANVSNLTVDVYGKDTSVTINGSTELTSLTIKDVKYSAERNLGLRQSKNSVTLSGSWSTSKNVTLNMEDVATSGSISMSGPYTHTVKLTNADVAGITLDGTGTDAKGKHVCKAQTVTVNSEGGNVVRSSTVGAISVKGDSSSVSLVDATATSVTLDGTNTKLTVGGNSSVGGVTLQDHLTDNATNTQLSTVTVKGTVSGDIKFGSSVHAAKVKVDVQAGGKVTDSITLNNSDPVMNADVDVTAATVNGTITVEGGTVDVGNNATVTTGLVMSGSTTFKVNGSSNTVNGISVTGNQVNMTIPADSTNHFGIASGGLDAYTKANIMGGLWDSAVPTAALSSAIDYELEKNSGTYKFGYYTESQLASALTEQGTSAGSSLRCKKIGLGESAGRYQIVFKNGKDTWGKMYVNGGVQIKLPAQVNTVTVTRWTDLWRSYVAGASYTTPAFDALPDGTTEWELNAGGGITNGDITKFTGVGVESATGAWAQYGDNMGTVKGVLNGTVITLSGAVPKDTSTMTLVLYTDAVEQARDASGNLVDTNKPVVLRVGVTYDSYRKTLVFSNVKVDLGYGVTLETENGIDIMRLSNGTKYTLNGSGLKERASQIKVATNGNNYLIEASANGVSSLRTQAARNAVVGLINGSYGTDKESAKFDWSNSPAMNVAVNAALATITDQNVETWIKAAQKAAWDKLNTGTYNQATDGVATGYDTAYLVPYLQVNLTNYVEGSTATATLVPSWRVEVRQSNPTATTETARYQTIFYDANDPSKPANAYIAKAGTSLGQLTGEFGTVEVNFNENFFMTSDFYMHQDNTYGYKYASSAYKITHAGTGSNGLGTVVFNTTEPLVNLYTDNTKAGLVARYDALQAAVDDAKDGQHIDVNQNYKGSTSITVTGDARKFTIQANGNNVVIANASGGLVEWNGNGSEYTVQLNRNNTTVAADATTATIAVNSVANGSAVVSATTAKSGTTITVTCTPAAGYSTRSVTVSAHMTKTNTNSAVTATKVSDNVYSFKVPQGADTITVTPNFVLGTTPAAIPFTDVATNHWAYNSVKYVYDNGLMNGVNTAGTQFGGTQTLNRAMVVTILYRAAGSPYVGTSSSFSDVANNTWYSQAVAWANQNHIVEGYTNGTFQPTWNITRQELATILYRYNTTYKGRATTGSTTLANFPDQGNVSDWATAGMQWAVGNGIVNGITNGYSTTLSPSGSATRYEAATMLMRYGQGMGL